MDEIIVNTVDISNTIKQLDFFGIRMEFCDTYFAHLA